MHPKLYVLSAALFLAALSGCAAVQGRVEVYTPAILAEREIGPAAIDRDTTWEGRVHVTGDILVREGVTLTIRPGAQIRFDNIKPRLDKEGGGNMFGLGPPYFPGAEIIVRGRLLAVGTADQPITFTSSDKAAVPGAWGGINLLGSNGNVIEFCRIYYASEGVSDNASTGVVLNNVFSFNDTAISIRQEQYRHPAWMFIEHNMVVANRSGISARNCIANISFNDISKNESYGIRIGEGADARIGYNDIIKNGKGIYLSKSEPLRVKFNNIFGNKDYNIFMAGNATDVDARDNWWDTLDAGAVGRKIYDKSSDPSLGKVVFEPVLQHKVTGNVTMPFCLP